MESQEKQRERFLLFRIRRFQDPSAFKEIYQNYYPQLLRYLQYKIPTQQEAEDVLSDVFLQTWQYLLSSVSVENMRALLYRITRNRVATYYQQRGKAGVQIELNEATISLIDERQATAPEIPEEEEPAVLSIELVKRWVRMLDGDYRDILHMRYFDELSIREIAEVIGKTENNTRVILHRGLTILRERYAKHRTDEGQADHPGAQSNRS